MCDKRRVQHAISGGVLEGSSICVHVDLDGNLIILSNMLHVQCCTCIYKINVIFLLLCDVQRIIVKIRSLPGNDKCADCGAPDPDWLSVNMGILICIHCSGRHRELSVQYSRIRSLTLDQLKTTELLVRYYCVTYPVHAGNSIVMWEGASYM